MRGSATQRVFQPRFLYHQTPRGWESLPAEPRRTSQLEHHARTAILPLPDTICPLWHPSASMTTPRNICLSGPVPHLLRPDQILDHSLSPLHGSSPRTLRQSALMTNFRIRTVSRPLTSATSRPTARPISSMRCC